MAYHLCLELGLKGHRIHILTRNVNGKLSLKKRLNSNIYIQRFQTPGGESANFFLKEFKNSYLTAKRLSREVNFDILCVHQSMAAIGPLLLYPLRRLPLFYYFHSPWHDEYLTKKRNENRKTRAKDRFIARIMRLIESRILFKSSRVIVLSQFMRDNVVDIHQCSPDKVRIIPGGVDLNRFQLPLGGKAAVKQDIHLPQDKTIFLTVRNLVPRMGLENLIMAFNHSKTLRDRSILLIGGSGLLEKRLKAMVNSFDLNKIVRFLGHIPDDSLPHIYQSADFFVLPTEKLEGFGLVILEAMACGIPVLGTPIGAIPEVIKGFDKRLLFKGTRWEDIKMKMEEVVEIKDLYAFDPSHCREFIENRYSWKKTADDFELEMKRYPYKKTSR